jgi:hypothetical protein
MVGEGTGTVDAGTRVELGKTGPGDEPDGHGNFTGKRPPPANYMVAIERLASAEKVADNLRDENARLVETNKRLERAVAALRQQVAVALNGRIKGAHALRSYMSDEDGARRIVEDARMMLDLGHVPEVRFGWLPNGTMPLSIELLAVGEDPR